MMTPEQFTVEVRSLALGRIGQVDITDIVDLKIIKRLNNVGSWSFSLPAEHEMAYELSQPGRGLVVNGPIGLVTSGPMTAAELVQDPDDQSGTYYYTGVDDNVFLADALVFPDPSNVTPGGQAVSHWEMGPTDAEDILRQVFTLNIGPSAQAARKPNTQLHLTTDGNLGAVTTVKSRFDNLGEFMAGVAKYANLSFDLKQDATGIGLYIAQPTDRSGTIRMDIANDLLDKVTRGIGAPTGTRYIVAGQGDLTERTIIQVTDATAATAESAWGRKVEVWKDRRDTNDTTILTQEGTEGLITTGRTITSLSVIPSNDTTMVFGIDWFLGDIVTVVVAEQELKTTVSEVIIGIDADGVTVVATVGDPTGFDYESTMIQRQEQAEERLSFLEKNAEGSGGGGSVRSVGEFFDIPAGAPVPSYALERNGQAVSRTMYGSLFALIGTTFGAGDGSTTFNVPGSSTHDEPLEDTGWLTVAAVSPFTGTVQYRRRAGKVIVNLRGTGGSTTTTGSNVTVATLPVGFRPDQEIHGVGYWGSSAYDTAVSTAGVITIYASASTGGLSGEIIFPVAPNTGAKKRCIVATDQGSPAGVTVVNAQNGYSVGQILEAPVGGVIPSNCLAMGQSVSASIYAALAAVVPATWLSGGNIVLPDLDKFERAGRVPLAPGGVVNGTIVDGGRVTFSGVSAVSLNNIFTSDFDTYEIKWVITSASADYGVYVRFRASGTDDATGYAGSYMESVNSAGWVGATDATSARIGRMSSAGSSGEATFFSPTNASVVTRVRGGSIDNSAYQAIAGHRLATAKAHDGFTLIGPASMSGYVEVYGVRSSASKTRKVIVAADGAGEYSPTVQAALVSRVTALETVPYAVGQIANHTANALLNLENITVAAGMTFTGSNRLTVPTAGLYHLSVQQLYSINAGNALYLQVRVNGTNIYHAYLAAGTFQDAVIGIDLPLSAGDYVQLYAQIGAGATSWNSTHSRISLHRVG